MSAQIPTRWLTHRSKPYGWKDFGVNLDSILEASMYDTAWELAYYNGWNNDTTENDEGEHLPCPSDDDIQRALQTSLPLGLIFHRLCVGTSSTVPEFVQQAFDTAQGADTSDPPDAAA